ncbi:MAG: family 10 glycosylhydrolase, partial [Phycisphaerae bacterium]|nr:family 10 glycosylhydrolase [Phycisphaerae bacterium]
FALAPFAPITHSTVEAAEFRSFCADVWGVGFKSQAEINDMVARAVEGRYNAISPQVMGYQVYTGSSAYGAFWHSNIVPRAPAASGSFDPLAYLVDRAHQYGIEVHCWLVPYRVSTGWPPNGNATLTAHPEWFMTTQGGMNGGPSPVDGYYLLDPGSPDAQEYLISIVRELVDNYEIDGIVYDYIRYTQPDAGYPTYSWYTKSGLKRFQAIENYVGTPAPTGVTAWDNFRRREVTELVARTRAEVASALNPRQPLRFSCDVVTWGYAPADFTSSSAWARFQDWKSWLQKGFVDAARPMAYFNHSVNSGMYTSWVNAAIGWRYNRHVYITTGLYMNTFANSKTQLLYARSAGANGMGTYDYVDTGGGWSWYPYVAANVFTSVDSPPAMPWRDPATATEGTIWGQVTDELGNGVDNAAVGIPRGQTVRTDGNGYYVMTLVPAGAGGSTYTVQATDPTYGTGTASVTLYRGGITRQDLVFSDGPIVSIAADATDITRDESVHFTPSVSYFNGATGSSYVWHFGTETVPGSGSPAAIDHTFTTVGDIECYLEVTDTAAKTGESNHIIIHVNPLPVAYGDFDEDGDVDLADFGAFSACFNGPNQPYAPSGTGCDVVDADSDSDVDLTDFGSFQYCFNGPNRPPANGTDCY